MLIFSKINKSARAHRAAQVLQILIFSLVLQDDLHHAFKTGYFLRTDIFKGPVEKGCTIVIVNSLVTTS